MLAGIFLFGLSYFLIGTSSSQLSFLVGVIVFFIGFNVHEPIMQSLTVKYAKVNEKGKVLGVFNSFGYAGTFLGGLIGGFSLYEVDGSFMTSLSDISMIIVFVSIIWFLLILQLPNPAKTKNAYIAIENMNEKNYTALDSLSGTEEWYINNTEKLLIVKYDNTKTSEESIRELLNLK